MEKEVLQNSDLHFEHNQWRSELALWEDEMRSFKNRLEELVKRWTKKDVLIQLEHYQNQFILQAEVIDTLQHDINVHETDMAYHAQRGEDVIDRIYAKQHIEFRNRMDIQRKIYGELKHDFFIFLSKFM